MKNILFICTANHDRSPTAEQTYRSYPGVETRSAGIIQSAAHVVNEELVAWADVIFCMERYHERFVRENFPEIAGDKEIHTLNIPDYYTYMEPKLVFLIKERIASWLPA